MFDKDIQPRGSEVVEDLKSKQVIDQIRHEVGTRQKAGYRTFQRTRGLTGSMPSLGVGFNKESLLTQAVSQTSLGRDRVKRRNLST